MKRYREARINKKEFTVSESDGEEYDVDGEETLSDLEELIESNEKDRKRVDATSFYAKPTLWLALKEIYSI